MRRRASAFGSASIPSNPSQRVSNRSHSAASKPSGASSPRDMTHEHMAKTPLSVSSASSQLSSSTHSFRSPSLASKRRASVSESTIQSSTSGNSRSHPVRASAARAMLPMVRTIRINASPAGPSRRSRPSSRLCPCHRLRSPWGFFNPRRRTAQMKASASCRRPKGKGEVSTCMGLTNRLVAASTVRGCPVFRQSDPEKVGLSGW